MQTFWDRVDVKRSDDCWAWKLSKFGNGYGKASVKNRTRLAHRLSWEIANGPIPRGMMICHKCDNPPCVNPNHLFLATQKTNMQDCVEKKRQNNTRKTHCKQGHQLSSDNLVVYGKWRYCKRCRQNWARISYKRRVGD